MTERSFYWSDESFGDGVLSPYDNDEFSDIWRKLFTKDRASQGYVEGYLNELLVSNPVGDVIRIATGAALVDGKFYENDATIDNSIVSPTIATRHDRIILRKSFSAQTVRIATLIGEEGGAVPSLTQNDGVTWEIPLATVIITTAGAITITDERAACRTPLSPSLTGAFIKIDEIIADGTSPTIDFLNIPSTYNHLKLIGSGRMTGAILEATIDFRLNNDSGANYEYQQLSGVNAATGAAAATGQTEVRIGQIPAANATANHVNAFEILFLNYKNTEFYKQYFSKLIHMPSNALAQFAIANANGEWADVSAINRITLLTTTGGAGNYASGSIFSLYGAT